MAKPAAIYLMGPTASGKTAATEALIANFPVEIISVDSALVYRGMDIGTAKPDAEFLRRVPHHLIDVCDPQEPYSAGRFRDDAMQLMADIAARGKIPLLVGGTMLYFRALEQLDELPEADSDVRMALEKKLEAVGAEQFHNQLAAVDPESAARLHPNDRQRVIRALELYQITGRPMGELQSGASESPYRVLKLALFPQDRAKLHKNIEIRLDQMFQQGFVDEVRQLRANEYLSPDLPSIRAVGYRQVWEHLNGDYSLSEAKDRSLYATRQLAKRQITWLRKESELNRIDPFEPAWEPQLKKSIEKFLSIG